MNEFQKQEQFYLDNIIWLWERYDWICQRIERSSSHKKREELSLMIKRLYNKDIKSAYEDYYRYFGKHCTYQPKLSHLA